MELQETKTMLTAERLECEEAYAPLSTFSVLN